MDFDGDNDFSSLPVPQKRRHYKKDSRFVFDLYTLCYDENESVDTVELFTSIVNNTAADNWSEKVVNAKQNSKYKNITKKRWKIKLKLITKAKTMCFKTKM